MFLYFLWLKSLQQFSVFCPPFSILWIRILLTRCTPRRPRTSLVLGGHSIDPVSQHFLLPIDYSSPKHKVLHYERGIWVWSQFKLYVYLQNIPTRLPSFFSTHGEHRIVLRALQPSHPPLGDRVNSKVSVTWDPRHSLVLLYSVSLSVLITPSVTRRESFSLHPSSVSINFESFCYTSNTCRLNLWFKVFRYYYIDDNQFLWSH